jgi:Lysyl oxidase
MPRGSVLALAGSLVLASIVTVVFLIGTGSGQSTRDLLPNLDTAAPDQLSGRSDLVSRPHRFFLGFESAAGNTGAGQLVVDGSRPSRSQPTMSLVQRIDRSDGSKRSVRLPARLRYVVSPTHAHWHLLGFMRYELRTAAAGRVRRDRKTGFCLGDRYVLDLKLPGAPATARYRDECGRSKPDLLEIREGISVGFGDNYKPHLEGQEFDITNLPAGRYVLVHRVNPQRVLRESNYRDNASSMAFDLSWPRGRDLPPRIDVVARCPDRESCP